MDSREKRSHWMWCDGLAGPRGTRFLLSGVSANGVRVEANAGEKVMPGLSFYSAWQ